MKKAILILVIALSLPGRAQLVQKPDDKAYHVYAGAGVSSLAGFGLYKLTGKAGVSILGSFGAGVVVGAAKELIYDKAMHRGVPSWGDFGATVWGSVVGSIGVAVGINVHRVNQMERAYFEDMGDSLRRKLLDGVPDSLLYHAYRKEK